MPTFFVITYVSPWFKLLCSLLNIVDTCFVFVMVAESCGEYCTE